jgi:hypothetical protein
VPRTIVVHIVNRKEPQPIENQETRTVLYQSLRAMQVGYIQPLHRCRESRVDQPQRPSAFGHWAVGKKNSRSHDKLALYLPVGVSQSPIEFRISADKSEYIVKWPLRSIRSLVLGHFRSIVICDVTLVQLPVQDAHRKGLRCQNGSGMRKSLLRRPRQRGVFATPPHTIRSQVPPPRETLLRDCHVTNCVRRTQKQII